MQDFFSSTFPKLTKQIEDQWNINREELVEYLNEWVDSFTGSSMQAYFIKMRDHAKTAPHNHTNPWDVL